MQPASELEVTLGVERMEYEFAISGLKSAQMYAQERRKKVEDALQALFTERLRTLLEAQGTFSLDDAIKMGVPCIDCLMLVTPKTRPVHTFTLRSPRDEGGSWGADAQCGYRLEAVA